MQVFLRKKWMTFTCGFSVKVTCGIVAEKLGYRPYCYSDSGLNGNIMNQSYTSINGESLKIKQIVT